MNSILSLLILAAIQSAFASNSLPNLESVNERVLLTDYRYNGFRFGATKRPTPSKKTKVPPARVPVRTQVLVYSTKAPTPPTKAPGSPSSRLPTPPTRSPIPPSGAPIPDSDIHAPPKGIYTAFPSLSPH